MGLFDFLFGTKNPDEENGGQEPYSTSNRQEVSSGDFLLVVEDIFTITGRGTVVTGRVEHGSVRVGEQVYLTRPESGIERTVMITGIEKFRKSLEEAVTGDMVGILLRGINRNEVAKGDVLHK